MSEKTLRKPGRTAVHCMYAATETTSVKLFLYSHRLHVDVFTYDIVSLNL